MDLDLLESRRREEALNRRRLVVLHLDRQHSTGNQPLWRILDHPANDVESILAASKRRGRLVFTHVRWATFELRITDVRRIGDDQIETRAFFGSHRVIQGALSNIDSIRMEMPGGIPASQLDRVVHQLGGHDARGTNASGLAGCDGRPRLPR